MASSIEQISGLRNKQALFFSQGNTRSIKYRRESLERLKASVKSHEGEIKLALRQDLNKSSFEAYATEIGLVLHEIRYHLKHISRWARPQKVRTPLFALPSKSMIIPEPYGRVFIISPWNYPFQLPMVPLIGAIAAGNVVIIRQSRFSPNTNKIIRTILAECFREEHVSLIECDLETAEAALSLKWDMIFFTGSTSVGRKIYSAAARNLTPVILELGGKSPVVVDEDAVISVAAKRIVWAKLINAGQTCISPDYLLVHKNIREKLVNQIIAEIKKMYGDDPTDNPEYPKIISAKAVDRLACFIDNGKIIFGGGRDREKQFIEPTLLDASYDDRCMTEEIFGPVLPVISYSEIEEAISYINSNEKPLAVYYFSSDKKKQQRFIKETSSGACLINDLILHIANNSLPFGGVGESGMGRYHGWESFRAFSNLKAVMKTSPSLDIPLKYAPFGKKERLLRFFLR